MVDLSGDFRLPADVYEKWYKQKHTAPELISKAIYGLTEFNREKIKKAKLVSNPGCYPTGAAFALAPLLSKGLVKSPIHLDSKSGWSGAGNQPKEYWDKADGYGKCMPYTLTGHKHIPEIERIFGEISGKKQIVSFAPMLLPVERGIITNAHAEMKGKASESELVGIYKEFYKGEQFIQVTSDVPNIKRVEFTNRVEVIVKVDERAKSVIAVSAIDNLMKGAAGQAVQNMNVMLGIDEREGLGLADKCAL